MELQEQMGMALEDVIQQTKRTNPRRGRGAPVSRNGKAAKTAAMDMSLDSYSAQRQPSRVARGGRGGGRGRPVTRGASRGARRGGAAMQDNRGTVVIVGRGPGGRPAPMDWVPAPQPKRVRPAAGGGVKTLRRAPAASNVTMRHPNARLADIRKVNKASGIQKRQQTGLPGSARRPSANTSLGRRQTASTAPGANRRPAPSTKYVPSVQDQRLMRKIKIVAYYKKVASPLPQQVAAEADRRRGVGFGGLGASLSSQFN